ncbi:MAG: type II secretion system minor pseudopilin GspK [Desulfovibrionaceae bacterium]|nr:type II secretion system minor pseudopilin GspK [Desulfovibrionaceae bacterium]
MRLPRRRARQQGAALLAAMIVVALVAALAAAALWRQWRGVEVESAERARVQSSWLLTGALDWGRLILAGDLRESSTDHLSEPWAMPLAEARLSTFLAAGESSAGADRDAFLSGQITDLQSRLNVMNLVAGDGQQAKARFQRLFQQLGLPASELEALSRNLERANAAMQSNNTGANAADAPLLPRRYGQLAWLGVAPETLEALRPYVTVLPVSTAITPVNLNTASALAIEAALLIDLADAQRLVAARDRSPFKNTQDAAALLNSQPDLTWASVQSSYFEIRGRLRLDDMVLQEVAVVRRFNDPNRRGVITLWRERESIAAPLAAAAYNRPE